MEFWSTSCPTCGWEGSVRTEHLIRGCPRRGKTGERCGAPFATMPPPNGREPFERFMTDAEVGESQLIREWLKIPQAWVRNDAGEVRRFCPRPVTWNTPEGEAKARALGVILGVDPFPEPEGRPVRFEGGSLAAIPALLPAVERPEPPEPKALPPGEILPPETDEDAERMRSLMRSEPPPERGRGP